MYSIFCILFNVWIAVSLLRAGYAYRDWKEKDGPGIETFVNALFYGFFGIFIQIYYSCMKCCVRCDKFKNGKACKKYK